ncbi:MAG: hypothetical protein FJ319_06160 [SAR202 cluster bacterium]|nr:hypothetical protein [SAR202 cluster bacterium]
MTQVNRARQSGGDEAAPSAAAYNALLKQYGEAMIRIGQLESRVEQLRRQTGAGAGPSATPSRGPSGESPEVAALNAKIESLQATMAAMNQPRPSAPAQAAPGESEELRQMRLQMNNLANHLQMTEQQLASAAGGSHTRHHRRRGEHNRPMWKKFARKVGLSKSKSRRTRSGDSKPSEGG